MALYYDNRNGRREKVDPGKVSDILPTNQYNSLAVIHHGDNRIRSLFLNADEIHELVRKTWGFRNCPNWRVNACWGGRQYNAPDAPPSNCIGCRLRGILMEATGEDLRCKDTAPEPHPLKIPALYAVSLAASVWLLAQPMNAILQAKDRQIAALRQEVATFRRQKRVAVAAATFHRQQKHVQGTRRKGHR